MNSVYVLIIGFLVALLGYRWYAKYVDSKIIKSDAKRATPAKMYMDGVDFMPTNKSILFGYQFKSIAGAAPIIGPIIAVQWGWMPALIWILAGALFIGWVQDYSSAMIAMRHEGASFGGLSYKLISPRARGILLAFIYFYLLLIAGAFGNVVMSTVRRAPLTALGKCELPPSVLAIMGIYLDSARVLGERTAEMHLALAAEPENQAFAPESFTPHYVRGLFQSMRNSTTRNLWNLRQQLDTLPLEVADLARQVIDREAEILNCYRALREQRLNARRIRCHGDFDLSQALYTGKDFILIDFEGDPASSVSERTIKRSALRDVAGMMRSFHYAAWTGLNDHVQRGCLEPDCIHLFEPWARLWYRAVSLEYLRAYLAKANAAGTLAQPDEEIRIMLPAYLFHKAMHELGRELAARPAWLHVPLSGILSLLESFNPPAPAADSSTGTRL